MKLIKIAERKTMLKVVLDDGKETWTDTIKPVYEYAKKNFKEGEDCVFTYEKKGDLPFITRIEKVGQQTNQKSVTQEQKPAPVSETKKYTCSDCGKELKDGRYTRCYDCNKKTPQEEEKSTSKSDKTSNSIEKQNVNNATSRALIALQGHVNTDNILEVAEKLWNFFYKKLN